LFDTVSLAPCPTNRARFIVIPVHGVPRVGDARTALRARVRRALPVARHRGACEKEREDERKH